MSTYSLFLLILPSNIVFDYLFDMINIGDCSGCVNNTVNKSYNAETDSASEATE